jgi:hypothetical protein
MQHRSLKILCLFIKQAKYAFICTVKPCLKFKKWSSSYIYPNEHTFWLKERNTCIKIWSMVMALRSVVDCNWCFGGTCCLHLEGYVTTWCQHRRPQSRSSPPWKLQILYWRVQAVEHKGGIYSNFQSLMATILKLSSYPWIIREIRMESVISLFQDFYWFWCRIKVSFYIIHVSH